MKGFISFKVNYYYFFCPTVFLTTALIPEVEVVVHKKRKSKGSLRPLDLIGLNKV